MIRNGPGEVRAIQAAYRVGRLDEKLKKQDLFGELLFLANIVITVAYTVFTIASFLNPTVALSKKIARAIITLLLFGHDCMFYQKLVEELDMTNRIIRRNQAILAGRGFQRF